MSRWLPVAALAAILGTLAGASAQDYPSHPITMIVPYPAGGTTDTIARIIIEGMRPAIGQPILIDNVGGASGSIGVGRCARAAPDGYTICMGSLPTFVINGAVYPLKYDLVNDFDPVALLPLQPMLIVARKTMPANDMTALIAWLKANPNRASQGTTGAGAVSHAAGVLFQEQTGTRFQFVPYRGTAMNDLVAGQVDLMIDLMGNSLPQVRAGTIKAYAVTAAHRRDAAPDIPTVDEAGLPGFHIAGWHALFVPKGTPAEMIARINAAAVAALADPAVRKRLTDLSQDIPPREQQTPQALDAFHKAEIAKWWPVLKAAHITAH